jgi:hypothetical protein
VIGVLAIKQFAVFGPEGAMKSGLGMWLFLHVVKIVDCLWPILPVPPFEKFRIMMFMVGKIHGAPENIEDATVDGFSLEIP